MTWIILICLLIVIVKCIRNKIAAMALLMYIEENYKIPEKDEIEKYTSRAAKKYFHIPS